MLWPWHCAKVKVKVIFTKFNNFSGNNLGDISNIPLFIIFSSPYDLDLWSRSLLLACFSMAYVGAIFWHKFRNSTVDLFSNNAENDIFIGWPWPCSKVNKTSLVNNQRRFQVCPCWHTQFQLNRSEDFWDTAEFLIISMLTSWPWSCFKVIFICILWKRLDIDTVLSKLHCHRSISLGDIGKRFSQHILTFWPGVKVTAGNFNACF